MVPSHASKIANEGNLAPCMSWKWSDTYEELQQSHDPSEYSDGPALGQSELRIQTEPTINLHIRPTVYTSGHTVSGSG